MANPLHRCRSLFIDAIHARSTRVEVPFSLWAVAGDAAFQAQAFLDGRIRFEGGGVYAIEYRVREGVLSR